LNCRQSAGDRPSVAANRFRSFPVALNCDTISAFQAFSRLPSAVVGSVPNSLGDIAMKQSALVSALFVVASIQSTGLLAQEPQATRSILGAARDAEARLVGVCNPNEDWRYRTIADLRSDLESGVDYTVACTDGTGSGAKVMPFKLDRVTTEADGVECNNLSSLPSCADLGVTN